MQKLDFNKDGKLVAYTDNGCTDGKSATTELLGTFEVSADVVKFILSKEYELPATLRVEMGKECLFGHYRYKHLYCLIGNEEQQKLLESYKDELSNVKEELKRLREAVDDLTVLADSLSVR